MATPAPSEPTLIQALLDAVTHIYEHGNKDELTIKRVRARAEQENALSEGFFGKGYWRAKSKVIIYEAVVSAPVAAFALVSRGATGTQGRGRFRLWLWPEPAADFCEERPQNVPPARPKRGIPYQPWALEARRGAVERVSRGLFHRTAQRSRIQAVKTQGVSLCSEALAPETTG